jgi:hypothetical protein
VAARGGEKYLVDFGRFRALAEIRFPVQEGEILRVRVEETGEKWRLALDNPPAQTPAAARELPARMVILASEGSDRLMQSLQQLASRVAALPPDISRTVTSLLEQLRPLDPGWPIVQLAARLKALVDDSGLFVEKKLAELVVRGQEAGLEKSGQSGAAVADAGEALAADRRPQLLQLLEFVRSEEKARPEAEGLKEMRRTLEDTLAAMDLQQREALGRPTADTPVLFFPVPVKEAKKTGRLKIYYPQAGKKGARRGFRLSLLLDLEHLGPVRSDLLWLEHRLGLTFFVMDEEVWRLFKEHCLEIEDVLRESFADVRVEVQVARDKINEFDSEDLVDGEWRILDVRV